MDLSVFNYQLAQEIATVVLAGVPASTFLDATIYTEDGSTPQSQTVRITVKFYDGDSAQSNALLALAPNLVRHPSWLLLETLGRIIGTARSFAK